MSLSTLAVGCTALYVFLLFAIARYGDMRADAGRSLISSNVYALSLAVYCTSWTFYGSVGSAASGGLTFLTIYLGPTLVFLFCSVLVKMIRISKEQRITSIADFIASRYGKSHRIAGLVTVIAVCGIVPYIALQLKAVASTFAIVFQQDEGVRQAWWQDSTLLIAVVLAVFTIVFGTRQIYASERHEGLVTAIAAESLVKLLAFMAVGLFVTYSLFDGFGDLFHQATTSERTRNLLDLSEDKQATWMSYTLLAGLAIVLLPRQFQIAVVENVDESHVRRAVWLFPLYLLLINIFVLPVALGGVLQPEGQARNADTFVLTLPMDHGNNGLATLAFVGGFSAATGMVVVETIALATMVCNDLIMPWLLRARWFRLQERKDLSTLVIAIRRAAIVVIIALGYLYFRSAGEAYALVSIGLISFVAVAQFAPAVLGGMYWKHGNGRGAAAGLIGGFCVWLYTLLLPSFAKSGWISAGFVNDGPFGVGLLKAQTLFGISGLNEISHCLFWSMFVNIGLYVAFSLFSKPSPVELNQAEQFVEALRRKSGDATGRLWRGRVSNDEVVALLQRFLGPVRTRRQLAEFAKSRGKSDWKELPADAQFVRFAEIELAGAIGSASARVMVSSVVEEEQLGLEEVLDILDEASQVRAYSRRLERQSRELEVATSELRAANNRLRELDRMKDDFISTVSHELRTPLTSIRALSEMLFDDPELSVEDRQRFLGIIVGEAERLTRLINQVLDIAKLESGRVEWQTENVDLVAVVKESAESMQQLFLDRVVALSVETRAAELVVLADHDRLKQVVINLLSNAVKFVPGETGEVRVKVVRDDQLARVEIADNGPGLSTEEKELVFEKFRQGGNTLTDKPQGTGLGLPISRQIVEYFGGRLWVESEPGQGAQFIFTLPLKGHNDNREGTR